MSWTLQGKSEADPGKSQDRRSSYFWCEEYHVYGARDAAGISIAYVRFGNDSARHEDEDATFRGFLEKKNDDKDTSLASLMIVQQVFL